MRQGRRGTGEQQGDEDVSDMREVAAHVAESIESARLVTIRGAEHLPTLERPEETNAELLAVSTTSRRSLACLLARAVHT